MNRRSALRVAGTATAAALGGTLALAANFGLLGFGRSDAPSLGLLEATNASAEPRVVTRYEDIFVPAPAPPPASVVTPPPVTTAERGDVDGGGSPTSSTSIALHVEERSTDDADDHEDVEDHREPEEEHEAEDVTEGLQDDD